MLRLRQVNRNHIFSTHRLHHIHGQVVLHAAVHQHLIANLHRFEHPGNRHARTHSYRQQTAAEHNRLLTPHLRCHTGKRDGQAVEGDGALAAHQAVEQRHDFIPVVQTETADLISTVFLLLPVFHSFRTVNWYAESGNHTVVVSEYALVRLIAVGHQVQPRLGKKQVLQVARTVTTAIERTHNRADARAGDVVKFQPFFFQGLQHPNLSSTFRTTAAEHQADARAVVPFQARKGRLGKRNA